jgi:hypothetical protein
MLIMTAIMGWRMRIMSPTRAAIPGRAASAGFRRLLREAAASRRRKFHHLLANLASRQLAPFRGAVEGATEAWAGMWFSVASPRPGPNAPPYQNGAHCGGHPQYAPRVRRARWEKLSAGQNKTAARMVMRNAADPRLSTPLKGRHESPHFRKPFYLVEPHRHLGPTSKSK